MRWRRAAKKAPDVPPCGNDHALPLAVHRGARTLFHSSTAQALGQEVSERGQEEKQEMGKGRGKASPLALQMLMQDWLSWSSGEVCSLKYQWMPEA